MAILFNRDKSFKKKISRQNHYSCINTEIENDNDTGPRVKLIKQQTLKSKTSQQQNHGRIRDNYGKISKENENLRKERMIILYKMNPTTQIK